MSWRVVSLPSAGQYAESWAKEELQDRLALTQSALVHAETMMQHSIAQFATAMQQLSY